jgi:hypothetical protein
MESFVLDFIGNQTLTHISFSESFAFDVVESNKLWFIYIPVVLECYICTISSLFLSSNTSNEH